MESTIRPSSRKDINDRNQYSGATDVPCRTTTRSERPADPYGEPNTPQSLARRAGAGTMRVKREPGMRRLSPGRPEEATAVKKPLEPKVGFIRPAETWPIKIVGRLTDQEIANRGDVERSGRSGRKRGFGTRGTAATRRERRPLLRGSVLLHGPLKT